MALGDRIKQEREMRGWTRAELAQRAGLTAPYISMLEAGKRPNPNITTMRQLAAALGLSVADLEGEDDQFANPVPPVPTWRQLGVSEDRIAQAAAIWADLSRDQRVKLSGHLQNSAISLAAVDALIEQVQVRVDALKAQVQEADDPPPTRDPVGPQDTVEVKGYEQSTRHGHIFSPG